MIRYCEGYIIKVNPCVTPGPKNIQCFYIICDWILWRIKVTVKVYWNNFILKLTTTVSSYYELPIYCLLTGLNLCKKKRNSMSKIRKCLKMFLDKIVRKIVFQLRCKNRALISQGHQKGKGISSLQYWTP